MVARLRPRKKSARTSRFKRDQKENAKILSVRHKTLFKPCSNRTKRLEVSLGGKELFLNSNGRSGCDQIRTDLPKATIKKSVR